MSGINRLRVAAGLRSNGPSPHPLQRTMHSHGRTDLGKPAPPPFSGSLRLATLQDIPRIGVVAAAGFYHAPFFRFERPNFNRFPQDTLASYRAEYRRAILDPMSAVLVVEDEYEKDEFKRVYDELRFIYPPLEEQIFSDRFQSGKVIVGITHLGLQADTVRYAEFSTKGLMNRGITPTVLLIQEEPSPDTDALFKYPDDRERDKSAEAMALYKKNLFGREEKWLSQGLWIKFMAVHPAYFKRGHAAKMTKWCVNLADTDSIGIGASAVPAARDMLVPYGFEKKEVVEVPGYKDHPESISFWIGALDSGFRFA